MRGEYLEGEGSKRGDEDTMSAGPGGGRDDRGRGAGVDLITGCQYIKATETKTNGYQRKSK